MPFVTLPLTAAGPVVDILVGVSDPRQAALTKGGQRLPKPGAVRALIDTGASCTVVDTSIIRALSLPRRGTMQIHTPSTDGTAHTTNQYDVSLIFELPNRLVWKLAALPVIEANFSAQGIHALIGRDVLQHALFTYNGPAEIFLLGF